jgi:transcriptional regulator with XRE-family HTH domain
MNALVRSWNYWPSMLPANRENNHLRCRIYELRKQNNWTLQQLAQFSGIPLNTVWRMERGYGTTLRNAFRMANVFRVTINDLWSIPPSATALGRNKEIAISIREIRRQRHWRLSDLAKLAGVAKSTLFQIENGHTPTLDKAVRIATALGVSVYQIWKPQQHQIRKNSIKNRSGRR